MVCRSCGTVIAEKAIVCYKCGAPTDDAATLARMKPGPKPKARARGWADIGVAAASVAGAVGFAEFGHPSMTGDAVAGGAAALVVLLVVIRRLR